MKLHVEQLTATLTLVNTDECRYITVKYMVPPSESLLLTIHHHHESG
jgi:hypothetical protein